MRGAIGVLFGSFLLAVACSSGNGDRPERSSAEAGAVGDGGDSSGSGGSTANNGGEAANDGAGKGGSVGTSGASGKGGTSSASCDDGFSCTIDGESDSGCSHTIGPNKGATACPAGQYCTVEDGCVKAPACATDADCKDAWAKDACKTNIRCDSASSLCLFDPLDKDGDGHSPQVCGGDDCDDGNGDSYPGAKEICDDYDNDCNGVVDENTTTCGDTLECLGGSCICKSENQCGNSCVDTQTTPEHCGSCDNACNPGEACEKGKCSCAKGAICGELFRPHSSSDVFVPAAVAAGYVAGPNAMGGEVLAVPEDGTGDAIEILASQSASHIVDAVVADGDALLIGGRANLSSGVVRYNLPEQTVVGIDQVATNTAKYESIIVRSGQVYWRNSHNAGIYNAPDSQGPYGVEAAVLDGSDVCTGDLASDDDYLYCGTATDIVRTGYVGGDATPLGADKLCDPVVVYDGNLYMNCPSGIEQMPVAGGASAFTQKPHLSSHTISWFTIDGGTLYFTEYDENDPPLAISETLYAGPVDGSTDPIAVSTGVQSESRTQRIAISDTYFYWAEKTGVFRATKPTWP